MRCVTLKVLGHVQGVFFRSSVREQANKLKVQGYVRNLKDGSVVVVMCAKEKAVAALIDFCLNNPGYSRVEEVERRETPELFGTILNKGFDIK